MKKALPILKNIFNWTFNILAVLLLVFSCFTVYNSYKTGEPANVLGYRPVFILTGSMEPEIKTNSIVITKNLTDEDIANIEVGDIVTYSVYDEWNKKDLTITHRIYEIEENENGDIIYTTKGDNNHTTDAYELTKDNLQAKVVFTWNGFASIYNQWNSGVAGKLIIILPIAAVILGYISLKLIFKEKNKKE